MEFKLTYHAIERLIERMVDSVKIFPELENFAKNHNSNCHIKKNVFSIIIDNSQQNKSMINNTEFMINYYERYGYENRFLFLDSVKYGVRLVFSINDDEENVLVTVVALKTILKTMLPKKETKEENIKNKQESFFKNHNEYISQYTDFNNRYENIKTEEEKVKSIKVLMDKITEVIAVLHLTKSKYVEDISKKRIKYVMNLNENEIYYLMNKKKSNIELTEDSKVLILNNNELFSKFILEKNSIINV